MRSSIIIQLLFSFAAVDALTAHPRSSINGPCTGKDGHAGVCISKSSCDGAGESWIHNACPGTSDDIKCCTKPSCQQAGRSGDCRWEDKCGAGSETLTGLCPGPNAFKCCVPKDDKPDSGGDLGKKILKKAKEAEGTPCKLFVEHVRSQTLTVARPLGRRQLQRNNRRRLRLLRSGLLGRLPGYRKGPLL